MADLIPQTWQRRSDVLVALFVLAFVAMLVIPLPAVMLDVFMAINIVLSLLIVLIVLSTRNALEFTVFPTLLLFATVFGLALNVSSTRLILAQGSDFSGQIVRAFGTFVVGSPGAAGLVIGLIIFTIIIAVQFVVITKGATRVAEVAARFTLDALPGRQMAIDAEYGSGLISEQEATRRKSELQRQSDFYGAMDGACKFVSGNVRVGILITAVNIVGGLIVGTTIHGEPWPVAVNTYVALTVGDGLVTQLPALLISTATGIIVTRTVSESSFGGDLARQFAQQDRPYWIAAAALAALALLPGFPWYVLLPLAAGLAALAQVLRRRRFRPAQNDPLDAERASGAVPGADARAARGATPAAAVESSAAETSPVTPLDPLSLELGYALIPLADAQRGAELLDRIGAIRRQMALELGLPVPKVNIVDDGSLRPPEYRFKIRGTPAGGGTIRVGCYLAVPAPESTAELPGDPVAHPAYERPVWWIADEELQQAERLGFQVVEPQALVACHLTELLRRRAADILGREEVKALLDGLRGEYPTVVSEATEVLSVGQIQKVLQALLAEEVSIRDLVSILETLADYAPASTDVGLLTEQVRQALKRQICLQHACAGNTLRVLTVHPELEERIAAAGQPTARGPAAVLPEDFAQGWIDAVTAAVTSASRRGRPPVLLCSENARALARCSVTHVLPRLAVLSPAEIIPELRVVELGQVALAPVGLGGGVR